MSLSAHDKIAGQNPCVITLLFVIHTRRYYGDWVQKYNLCVCVCVCTYLLCVRVDTIIE